MTAGECLRRVREMRGDFATSYAEKLGISPQYLNDIERDRRSIPVHRLSEFAEVYRVDAGNLFELVVPLPPGYRIVKIEEAGVA